MANFDPPNLENRSTDFDEITYWRHQVLMVGTRVGAHKANIILHILAQSVNKIGAFKSECMLQCKL